MTQYQRTLRKLLEQWDDSSAPSRVLASDWVGCAALCFAVVVEAAVGSRAYNTRQMMMDAAHALVDAVAFLEPSE